MKEKVQLIQCRVTCLYSFVLSVNWCAASAKFVVKWEEINVPPVTDYSPTSTLSLVNLPQLKCQTVLSQGTQFFLVHITSFG